MESPESLNKKLHDMQLRIAKEVRRICEAHDIKYFVIAGTLLGAVRHRGFIPWDDDMDIGMLREDYERFLHFAAEELPRELFLQTWHSDEAFGLPMAKVRKQGTKFIEVSSEKASDHKGVFIDIFPYDAVPHSKAQQMIQNYLTYILKRVLLVRLNYQVGRGKGLLTRLLLTSFTGLTKAVPTRTIVSLLEREMRRFNTAIDSDVVTIGGSYGYHKETLKRQWVSSLTEVEFEGSKWPAFSSWQKYLEHMYGDYMQWPPLEKRGIRHNVLKIDLG